MQTQTAPRPSRREEFANANAIGRFIARGYTPAEALEALRRELKTSPPRKEVRP